VPHGSFQVGDIEVIALCDGIADAEGPLDESFPGVTAEQWAEYRNSFPEVFSPSGGWRLHIHAFVLRTPERCVLVDTGAGPAGAPGREWAPECGRLADELREESLDPMDIDTVVLTHVHDDHIGGTVLDDGSPAFPNARYLMHQADWDALDGSDEPEDLPYRDLLLGPLRDADALDFVDDGHVIGPGLEVLYTPGHTPGHISVLVSSSGEQLLVAGDVLNHPGQVADLFPSASDHDPAVAAHSRERILSRLEREDIILSTSHFPEPFGQLENQDGRRVFLPI
jgi:glyoxylase-like metal-dependent hydrolase (beta-lactamase superfamily II)